MKKIKLLVVFIFGCLCIAYSQGKNIDVTIDWTKGIKSYNNQGYNINYFNPTEGNWDIENHIPYSNKSINIPNYNVTFVLNNYNSVAITQEENKCLINGSYPTEFKFDYKIVSSRKKYKLVIKTNAIRKNPQTGILEKLVSYNGSIITKTPVINNQIKNYATTSVLKSGSGDWYKIGLTKDGVYKIDYNFLKDIGVDIDNITPNSINIYGNATGMLPENNSEFRFDDLAKNSIYISGDSDGSFDKDDYILFYCKGPNSWELNGGIFTHSVHQYSDSAFYFININTSSISPKRIGNVTLSNSPITHNITTFNDYNYVEDEKYNLGKSGREWFGDVFDVKTSYSYQFNFPNLIIEDSIHIRTNTLIYSTSTAPFFSIGIDNNVKNLPNLLSPSGSGQYRPYAIQKTNLNKLKTNNSLFSINISFNKAGQPSSVGWLDFLEVNVKRNLSMSGNQMEFRALEGIGVGNVSNFILNNSSSVIMVWEVTDPRNVKSINFNRSGSQINFKLNTDSLRSFVAINNSGYLTPTFSKKIEHQNLHSLEYTDMIIVSAPEFITASNKLATFHKSEGLSVSVVTTEQIYNEFSSGVRDATAIKSFLRMFYKRAGNNANLIPKYCLLMGDGSYDNRNILVHNKNFIPTYESVETLSKTASYTTDDYFVILSDNGGMNNYDLLDMGIGRLPVNTLREANEMVDKIIHYSKVNNNQIATGHCEGSSASGILSDWRNIAIQISDDGDNNHYFNDIELMYNKAINSHPEINISKIHADAYVETSTAGGDRNYGAEREFKQQVQKGALLVNYIGHGGETGLGHERYLTLPTIHSWTNLDKMPVFMTATCEFSRFDDHDRTSAGEFVVLNPNGGGIGLFTTTRLVYATSNAMLNGYFYDTIFDKVNNKAQRLGDIYMGTKNKYASFNGDVNYRKFAFLGDPAIRLALPNLNVVTDSINGKPLSSVLDTINALSKVVIKGHIENHQGQKVEDFNGIITTKIYDKKANLRTLGSGNDSFEANFNMWKNLIYKGKASVKNGEFVFSFIVPKDISFHYGNARISYYAENGETDANGYSEKPIIGGINSNAEQDNTPPSISLFMNNDKFVSGGITDENPSLFAKIFDENGINTVGNGIGHNIEAIIDKDTKNAIILNDFYETELDTYKKGTITYPFEELKPGNHTLSLKVWDVYNNSNTEEIEFVVALNEKLAINHILNYPNPFTTNTYFHFEHNQVCDYLDVQIQIFTISGKVVKTINKRVTTNGYRIDNINWNGTDDFGENIGKGVYVYKVKVINEKGDKAEKFEKLVILK